MIVKTKIAVRYPDCDAMGIVHHAVYPIWYEMGRMDLFRICGWDYEKTHALGVDPAMVELKMKYAAPVGYPDEVTLITRLTLLSGKKIAFGYELYREGADRSFASGESFHIWVKDGKAFDLEHELPEAFDAYAVALNRTGGEQ